MGAEYAYIGKSVPRVDALGKVTGRSQFVGDLKFWGMLHGKVLRSPHAHARILNIDWSRAQRVPGVRAILTGKDFPDIYYGYIIKDQTIFCIDKVRLVGDAVAGVVATSEAAAEEACDAIAVEYDPLPSVLDPFAAMEPGAPVLHEALTRYEKLPITFPQEGTNICQHAKLRKGDLAAGFREADYVFEDRFSTQLVQHCCLEPHIAVAIVEPAGKVTMWTSTQSPSFNAAEIARALRIPLTEVRIIVPYVGGGFGAKHGVKIEMIAWAMASAVRGKPVRLCLSREEEFPAVVKHPCHLDFKTGVRADGTITAREIRMVWDTGGYSDAGPLVSRNGAYMGAGPYSVPHLKVDSYCVYTNKHNAGAFRGYGTMQYCWAYESQMDMIAERLGIDPVDIRMRNLVEEGSISHTGEVLHSVGVKETLRRAVDAIGWQPGGREKNRGKGFACMWRASNAPTTSAALIKINGDYSANIYSSTTEIGQGKETILSQIVAEELGIPLARISIVTPDTEVTPPDRSTTSSRSTFHMGNAVRAAAQDIKAQLLAMAATSLGVDTTMLKLVNERIVVAQAPDRGVPIRQLLATCPVLGRGVFYLPNATGVDAETGQGERPTAFWMFATQATELDVDPETGRVKILKIVAAHDVGKAINPLACEQQIEGAVAMGVGTALYEEILVNDRGETLNPNFTDYRIPTALDVPLIQPILVEEAHPEGPYGAKGLGEPGLTATAPCIANALYNTIGVRFTSLPITPERIWRELVKARAK